MLPTIAALGSMYPTNYGNLEDTHHLPHHQLLSMEEDGVPVNSSFHPHARYPNNSNNIANAAATPKLFFQEPSFPSNDGSSSNTIGDRSPTAAAAAAAPSLASLSTALAAVAAANASLRMATTTAATTMTTTTTTMQNPSHTQQGIAPHHSLLARLGELNALAGDHPYLSSGLSQHHHQQQQQQQQDPFKFKTQLCRNLLRDGHCAYGTNCMFAHSCVEVRPVSNSGGGGAECRNSPLTSHAISAAVAALMPPPLAKETNIYQQLLQQQQRPAPMPSCQDQMHPPPSRLMFPRGSTTTIATTVTATNSSNSLGGGAASASNSSIPSTPRGSEGSHHSYAGATTSAHQQQCLRPTPSNRSISSTSPLPSYAIATVTTTMGDGAQTMAMTKTTTIGDNALKKNKPEEETDWLDERMLQNVLRMAITEDDDDTEAEEDKGDTNAIKMNGDANEYASIIQRMQEAPAGNRPQLHNIQTKSKNDPSTAVYVQPLQSQPPPPLQPSGTPAAATSDQSALTSVAPSLVPVLIEALFSLTSRVEQLEAQAMQMQSILLRVHQFLLSSSPPPPHPSASMM